MTNLAMRSVSLCAAAFCASVLLTATPVLAEGQTFSKDQGPASAACDGAAKGSPAWTNCVGQPNVAMADEELFYAGYWLAKNGQYEKALGYLTLARKKDERVLTYIGFATRKLGHVDEALPLYRKALAVNPDYVVARAYMGEAFLTKHEPDKARAELAEIARRCGTSCPAYVDLDNHIQSYAAANG